jgi:hypothetical protein
MHLVRQLSNGNDFIAYIDAIGKLDGNDCLLEWKTTTSRLALQQSRFHRTSRGECRALLEDD